MNSSGVWKDIQPPCEGLLALLHFSLGAGTSMGMEHKPGSSTQEFLCKTKAIDFCPGQKNGNWCHCQNNLKPAWEELFLLFPFSHISFPSAEVLVNVEISIGREVAREIGWASAQTVLILREKSQGHNRAEIYLLL